jgi:peptide/nickel transport system substrate-binding protein
MLNRRRFLAATAGTLAMPALARAESQTVLKFVPQADLAVVDPIWTTATVTRNHAFLVFDTLYGQNAAFRAVPQMAEGATQEDDGKTWNITLRPGLMFHDGSKVLARDCVASLRRWGKRDAFGQALMAVTDDLSAPDDRTIRFRLRRPFALLPDALAKNTSLVPVIMPERLALTDPFTQVTEMIGSGPFRFLSNERLAGARAVYAKFDGYKPRSEAPEWTAGAKIVHFDRIEWITQPDPATAAAALQNGEVDYWEYPTPDLQPLLRRDKNLVVEIIDTTGSIAILRMNQLFPPFDNPAIRRAVLGAVNQADFMTAVAGDDTKMWKTGIGVFPPGTTFASDVGMDVLTGPRDLDRVKREIAAAGYKGEPIVLMGASDLSTIKAEADVGADMFTRAGFNVDYQVMDWGTLVRRRAKKDPPDKGGWNVFFTGWSGTDMFNPAGHLSLRGNGADSWFGWPTAPKIEALRSAWLEASDLNTQKKICAEIQAQVFEDVPYIPLGQYFQPVAHRRDVSGVGKGFPVFWGLQRT